MWENRDEDWAFCREYQQEWKVGPVVDDTVVVQIETESVNVTAAVDDFDFDCDRDAYAPGASPTFVAVWLRLVQQ